MSRQSEILNNTLEAVNKNNAITVSFSNREKIIIKNMMEQYAKLCSEASLEKASEKLDELYFDCNVISKYDIQSIKNSDNIVIL